MNIEIQKLTEAVDKMKHCMAYPEKHPAYLRHQIMNELWAANDVVKNQIANSQPVQHD